MLFLFIYFYAFCFFFWLLLLNNNQQINQSPEQSTIAAGTSCYCRQLFLLLRNSTNLLHQPLLTIAPITATQQRTACAARCTAFVTLPHKLSFRVSSRHPSLFAPIVFVSWVRLFIGICVQSAAAGCLIISNIARWMQQRQHHCYSHSKFTAIYKLFQQIAIYLRNIVVVITHSALTSPFRPAHQPPARVCRRLLSHYFSGRFF